MPTKKRQGQGRRQEMGTKVVRGGAIGKVVMCTASGASGVWLISMVTGCDCVGEVPHNVTCSVV